MANSAYLVGGDDPEPARPLDSDGGYSYTQFGVETLAGANYTIPVLWLFCFETADLVSYDASDLNNGRSWTVASTVIQTDRAVQLLATREPLVARWTGVEAFWDEFTDVVSGSGFRYLKMDLLELDMMHTEGITEPLTRALRWFDTDSPADLAGYDAITYYDATDSDAGIMARGYRCGRPVPWDDEPGR